MFLTEIKLFRISALKFSMTFQRSAVEIFFDSGSANIMLQLHVFMESNVCVCACVLHFLDH
jgi:hypothetical protein